MLQAAAAQIHITRSYTVCSLYLPPSAPLNQQDLMTLVQQLPPPFLIVGDFNSRLTLWEDSISNPRGVTVASVIGELDLCILSTGHPTHYHIQTDTWSIIDLFLSSPDAYLNFVWEISGDLHGSDHYPIFISHHFSTITSITTLETGSSRLGAFSNHSSYGDNN